MAMNGFSKSDSLRRRRGGASGGGALEAFFDGV